MSLGWKGNSGNSKQSTELKIRCPKKPQHFRPKICRIKTLKVSTSKKQESQNVKAKCKIWICMSTHRLCFIQKEFLEGIGARFEVRIALHTRKLPLNTVLVSILGWEEDPWKRVYARQWHLLIPLIMSFFFCGLGSYAYFGCLLDSIYLTWCFFSAFQGACASNPAWNILINWTESDQVEARDWRRRRERIMCIDRCT